MMSWNKRISDLRSRSPEFYTLPLDRILSALHGSVVVSLALSWTLRRVSHLTYPEAESKACPDVKKVMIMYRKRSNS